MATEEQIAEVAERLGRAAPDAVVILFGSHARGDAEEQSDVDLLIVEPEVESAFTETARLERALEGLDVSTDLIVVTRERYDRWADERCTVVYEAARDGRIVYAPPGSDLRLRPEHRREVTYISEEAIQAVTARLREAAPDATIILFGPYARGKPRPTSDLDILVVEPQVVSRFDETARLAEAVDELDVPTGIVVVSAAAYDHWAAEPGTAIHDAATGGRVLHAPGGARRDATGQGRIR